MLTTYWGMKLPAIRLRFITSTYTEVQRIALFCMLFNQIRSYCTQIESSQTYVQWVAPKQRY